MLGLTALMVGSQGDRGSLGISATRVLLAATAAVVMMLCLTVQARGGQATGKIWGDPLPKVAGDKDAFRPVLIPAWLEDATSYIFSSPEEAKQCKAQMAPLGIGGLFDVYYPSKLLPMSKDFAQDYVQKQCEAFAKNGIRCIAAIPPRFQSEMYIKHPDWRSKMRRDQPLSTDPWGGDLCMMGPWGDYLIDVLAEAMTMYPGIVGYSFDGIHNSGICYCDHCIEDYRKETGKEIPEMPADLAPADYPRLDMNNPECRYYQRWIDHRIENFCVKLQTRLKAINPDFALVSWTTNAGRFGHFLSIPRNMPTRMNLLFDSPGQEYWLDETNRGNTVVPAFANAYIWATTNHRHAHSEPYLMSHGNPYGCDSFPPEELFRRCMLTVTWGAQVGLATGWTNLHELCQQTLLEVDKRKNWLSHKQPEWWAAMVMSDDTNCFYGRDYRKDEERYLSNVFGTFRTGIEKHLPLTLVNDWNLNKTDLARYKVLVLPNTAVIGEEQAEAVRQYVRNGGGLVASVDATLFDEYGNPRKDFLLADVFGVHYQGVIEGAAKKEGIDPNFAMAVNDAYWDKRKNIFQFKMGKHELLDTPRLKQYVGDKPVTFKGQAVSVSVDADAQAIATITAQEQGSAELPAMVVHRYGKGKVVYMAGGFDSAYYLYPYPYYRELVAQAMLWAASEEPKIQVDAPMCVHSTMYRQTKDGQRLVVHLFNDLNTAGNHAKPDDDVPLREETLPVHDIKVLFKGYDITRVHLEPGGAKLATKKTSDGIEVTVPKLDVHSMVVAELK